MLSNSNALASRHSFVAPFKLTSTEIGNLARLLGTKLSGSDIDRLQNICALYRHRLRFQPLAPGVMDEVQEIRLAAEHLASLVKPAKMSVDALAALSHIDEFRNGQVRRSTEWLAWELARSVDASHGDQRTLGRENKGEEFSGRGGADFVRFYDDRAISREPEQRPRI